jgi:predicted DNA-binding transcriptional regulator AlpA
MAEIYNPHTLLTETDVSKQLRVSLAALRKWRVLNRGPQFVKLGPLVRYRQDDIDSWLGALPVGGGRCHETALPIRSSGRSVEALSQHLKESVATH